MPFKKRIDENKKPAKPRLKKGDQVQVQAGKSKGKIAHIKEVIRERHLVLVEGVNLIKKHMKPNPQLGVQGGVVTREAPIDISNVAIWNAKEKKKDKVGYKIEEDGKKVRIFKSTGEVIDR
jgi:large subunit ribosomal protein L24